MDFPSCRFYNLLNRINNFIKLEYRIQGLDKQKFFNFLEISLKMLGIIYLIFGLYAVGFRVVNKLLPGVFESPIFFILFLIACLLSSPLIKRVFFNTDKYKPGIIYFTRKLSFLHIVLIGLVLRVLWVLFTDTALVVDAYSYYVHTKNLVYNGYFGFDNYQPNSFWPPGYPFFLAVFMLIFGETPLIFPLSNLVLYILTMLGVWNIARLEYGDTIAKLSLIILVAWPNYIFLTNTGAKEALVVALISWAIYYYFGYLRFHKRIHLYSTVILTGMMILVQPSLGVIFVAFVITHFLKTQRIISTSFFLCVMLIGITIIISPWTYRNYLLYEKIVPVSTNGGFLFYNNNNDQTIPGYNGPPLGFMVEFPDPVDRSSKGYEFGIKWIKENPEKFINLSYHKGLYYLGNDDPTLWQIFNYRDTSRRPNLYYFGNMVINLYWLMIMAIILYRVYFSNNKLDSFENFVTLGFLGLLIVDMLYEAGTRHHIPLYPLMAILCAKALVENSKNEINMD